MKKIIAFALAACLCLALAVTASAEGSVYYLNFKPEQDPQWQELAKLYTEKTGVPVTVVTAASGNYETTLMSEIEKNDPPTLFQVNGPVGLANWKDYCYDLKDAEITKHLTSDAFALKEDDKVYGVAYVIETYGLIANTKLLEKAGYKASDITNFETLKKVADDIHSRAAELGFDAFSSAGLEGSSSWRFSGHLANMPLFYEFRDDKVTAQPAAIKGTYLDAFKNVWDLYTTDSATTGAALTTATGDASEAEFGQGKAVFYQNGTWEYSNLTGEKFGMNADDLTMIPIYCGIEGEEKAGLCTGTENYWSVNKNASEEDIKATLDFLNWVVTSEEGTAMMAEQFGACPFQASKAPSNPFSALANEYVANGCYPVTWAFT